MHEEEADVNHIERTRFPWQWVSQDIDLLELKFGGDWAIVGVVRWAKHGKESSLEEVETNRGNIGLISTAVTWALGNFFAMSIALLYPNGTY